MNTALSLGENIYTSRPNATITQDNVDTIVDVQTVYARNFHVSGTPEIASTTSLNYRSRYGFFVNLSFNWTDRIWMQFNPVRRTFDATQDVFDETTYNEIIAQEKLLPSLLWIFLVAIPTRLAMVNQYDSFLGQQPHQQSKLYNQWL